MAFNREGAEEKRQKFYEKLEEGVKFEISDTLKNILRYQSMDQAQMLLKFDKDYASIEVFVRSEAYKSLMTDPNDETELEKFYGVFSKNPKEFTFTNGLKFQLESMIEHIETHPRKFKMINTKQQVTSPNISRNISLNDTLDDPDQVQSVEEAKLLKLLHDSKSKMDGARKEKLKEVSVAEVFQSQRGMQAKLVCPLCKTSLVISKVRSKISENWSLSNFLKHIKRCGDKPADESNKKSRKKKRHSDEENHYIDVENDSSDETAANFLDNQSANSSRLPLRELNLNSVNNNDRVNQSQNLPTQQYESSFNWHYGHSEYGYDSQSNSEMQNNFTYKDYNPQIYHSTTQDMLPASSYGYVTETPINERNENEGFYSAMQIIQYQSEYQSL